MTNSDLGLTRMKTKPVKDLTKASRSFGQRSMDLIKKAVLFLTIAFSFVDCKKESNRQDASAASASNKEEASTSSTSDFTIVLIPDTQYYVSSKYGGNPTMFQKQIEWIKANRVAENIVYVGGLGDITEDGDIAPAGPAQWVIAKNILYGLETPYTGFPHGIPYGTCVGNHDQYPSVGGVSGPTAQYNQYFGVSHFSGRAYYGGHYGSNNNSHFDLFSVGTGADQMDFAVIYLNYDITNADWTGMNNWAYNLCNTYASRKIIVISHYIAYTGYPSPFGSQGWNIYNKLKDRPNVFMMANGHVEYLGYREDFNGNNSIKTFVSNYQFQTNGGDGYMRLMKFSKANNSISVKTFSPYRQFMGPGPHHKTDVQNEFQKTWTPVPTGKYKIIVRHSGKAVTVTNSSLTNGAYIQQWDYTDDALEGDEWNVTHFDSDGYYKIINARSGKVLTVENGSIANSARLNQWDYIADANRNDEWAIEPANVSGYYILRNVKSRLCLNVNTLTPGNGLENGAPIIQYPYGGGNTNMQLQFITVP